MHFRQRVAAIAALVLLLAGFAFYDAHRHRLQCVTEAHPLCFLHFFLLGLLFSSSLCVHPSLSFSPSLFLLLLCPHLTPFLLLSFFFSVFSELHSVSVRSASVSGCSASFFHSLSALSVCLYSLSLLTSLSTLACFLALPSRLSLHLPSYSIAPLYRVKLSSSLLPVCLTHCTAVPDGGDPTGEPEWATWTAR